jgi:hypothetical protein
MRIDDLPKGEQVVTTIKREDIPKDKPKPPPPLWLYVLIAYILLIFLWALKDNSSSHVLPPPEHYPPTHPPAKPYPPEAYPPCPIPKTPECPW